MDKEQVKQEILDKRRQLKQRRATESEAKELIYFDPEDLKRPNFNDTVLKNRRRSNAIVGTGPKLVMMNLRPVQLPGMFNKTVHTTKAQQKTFQLTPHRGKMHGKANPLLMTDDGNLFKTTS